MGTASHDHTWRLWDAETGANLLLQDGHIREVGSVAFQGDGALAASTDHAGVVRVWDLRSGRGVATFQGHVGRVLCAAWHPNGYQVVTGGDDHTCRVWDLRRRKEAFSLLAHSGVVSDVRWAPSDDARGELLLTASLDGSAKLWSARNYMPLATFKGHESKVMGIDFAPDSRSIVTAGYDRTFKVWSEPYL